MPFVQGRGSKYCIVMPKRNKYGVRVSMESAKNGPRSKSSCSDLEHTVSAYLVESGAGLRYSHRHQIICHLFMCVLEEQVTAGKEI
ncbi:hypothetical protein BDA96_10G021400 [Sorghum bicolor]|uniref:Uncharacterized protein n=1 Tax=Sorghum bicolor TaxID=4558 RepID=A0A921PY08_SORBI|nr:hypothetical protein BDA96_10G021400 [Sorghum bicolor]